MISHLLTSFPSYEPFTHLLVLRFKVPAFPPGSINTNVLQYFSQMFGEMSDLFEEQDVTSDVNLKGKWGTGRFV